MMPDRDDIPLVQAALNGGRSPEAHPAVPVTHADLAAEAAAAVAAGAGALHVHPRDPVGRETLDPRECAAALRAVRAACPGVPVSLTTGAWIEPDPDRRLALVENWTDLPDLASVNVGEPGSEDLIRLLDDRGVAVEAGVWTVPDAMRLAGSGLGDRCARVLVEALDPSPQAAWETASAVDDVLDRTWIRALRLFHGEGPATWAVVRAALARGWDVRVGLEDVLTLPDGRPASGNADLVAAAVRMRERGRSDLRRGR